MESKRKDAEPGGLSAIDPEMLARIQRLRLMDDDFMTVVFSGNCRLTELLLKIILGRDDLTVTKSMTQIERHNAFGRSVRLDVLAEDAQGRIYNVEIQRSDHGASARRARYNHAMIDARTLKKGDGFDKLPEVYVIFITENDLFGRGRPIYRVRKSVALADGEDLPFDDGSHIIYVNGAYNGDDAIGRLMADFRESDADNMNYAEIAESVRFHKQESEGVSTVCRIVEEYGNECRKEGRNERNLEIARKLIRDGTMPLERIADIADLPLARVREMAEDLR